MPTARSTRCWRESRTTCSTSALIYRRRCRPGTQKADTALKIDAHQVERLEAEIDALNASLSPLKSFVLPGGTTAAANLHLARTVCRRAERLMVALSRVDGETVDPVGLRYVNRLSDFLFVASRHANADGVGDVLWVPGQNR